MGRTTSEAPGAQTVSADLAISIGDAWRAVKELQLCQQRACRERRQSVAFTAAVGVLIIYFARTNPVSEPDQADPACDRYVPGWSLINGRSAAFVGALKLCGRNGPAYLRACPTFVAIIEIPPERGKNCSPARRSTGALHAKPATGFGARACFMVDSVPDLRTFVRRGSRPRGGIERRQWRRVCCASHSAYLLNDDRRSACRSRA